MCRKRQDCCRAFIFIRRFKQLYITYCIRDKEQLIKEVEKVLKKMKNKIYERKREKYD